MKYFNSIILSVLLVLPQLVSAQQISESEAKDKALSFFAERFSGAMRAPERGRMNSSTQLQLAYTAGNNVKSFYVYNNGDDGGFVIVSGDKRAEEILAFSNTGHFDYDKAPDNFKWWLKQTEKQIEAAQSLPAVEGNASRAGLRTAPSPGEFQKVDIPDLITTKWNQWAPYNSAIPQLVSSIDGTEYAPPTGCVQTAVAQIMNYWKYPEHGTGHETRVLDYSHINGYDPGDANYTPEFGVMTHDIDFETVTYDWDNMLDDYGGGETEEQKTAVAQLMYHAGVACQAVWGVNQTTGAYPVDGLKKYFGYSEKATEISRDEYDDQTWEEIIYTELYKGRPVLYGGSSEALVSHQFIIHGYSAENDMYSVNWGWGGDFDCYCKLTSVDGSSILMGYENHQDAIVNLQPAYLDRTDEVYYGYTFWSDGLKYRVISSLYNTVEIIRPDNSEKNYSGIETIPIIVHHDDVAYKVIAISSFGFSSYRFNAEENYNYQVELNIDSLELKGMRFLGNSAFRGSTIKKIILSDSIKQIGDECFSECIHLEEIRLPKNIIALQWGTFDNCVSLKKLEIPEGVLYIGNYCFEFCSNLNNLILPTSLVSIGKGCFRSCTHLFSLKCLSTVVPELDLSDSGMELFSDNSKIGTLYVPQESVSLYSSDAGWSHWKNVKPLEDYGDNECAIIEIDGLKYVLYSKSAMVLGEDGLSSQNILIPETIAFEGNNYSVKIIGERAFCNNSYGDVVLSDSIEEIFRYAFYSSQLNKLTISKNVISIEGSALCANVPLIICKSTNVPTIIGQLLVNDNTSLLVPKNLLQQYQDSDEWKRYVRIKSIEDTDPNFGRLIHDEGIEYKIDDGFACVFKSYNSIVNIKESILVDATVYPVTTVLSNAFANGSVREVYFPQTVTDFGSYVFGGATNLEKVSLGKGIKTIGAHYFTSCENLKYLNIPEGVETVEFEAFSLCRSLRTIVFPSTIKSIEHNCFSGCSSLDTIVILSSSVPFNYGLFPESELSDNCTLFVPEESLELYKSDDYWKRANKIEPIIQPSSIEISNKQIEISTNDSILSTVINPKNSTIQEVSWISSNSNVVIVSDNGVVSAVSPGSATIYAQSMYYPNLIDSCVVTVIIPKYLFNYIVDGDTISSDSISYGCTLIARQNPVKEGYTFSGWSEIPATMPAHDVTITGSFYINSYQLTYKVDGETFSSDCIAFGTTLTARQEPHKEGYTFSGWSEIPATMPANDITVTGSFTINKYLLTYKVDGETIRSDSIAYGTSLIAKQEPTKEGYTFSGWSEIPAIMPANNVEVTGSFSINSYILIYKVDGEVYHKDTLNYAANITALQDLTKEGYTFSGWSEIPSVMPANDIEVTGTFSINKYIVTFINYDNDTLQIDTLEYGLIPLYQGAIPLKEPERLYTYTFSGWSPEITTVKSNIMYYAVFDSLQRIYGDVTDNMIVDIQDATIVVNYILGERSDNHLYYMADMNSDDEIDIFDLTAIINVILGRTNFMSPMRSTYGTNAYRDYLARNASLTPPYNLEDVYLRTVSDRICLSLDNPERFTSFQFDIEVPYGAKLQDVELTASQNTHFVQKSKIGDNLYRVIALSMSSQPLSDNDNELISIRISDAADADIMVSNVMFVTPKGDAYYFNPATTKIPTVIDIISSDSDDKIYDLSGRRIYRKSTDLDKGVYIINNQKVIIK